MAERDKCRLALSPRYPGARCRPASDVHDLQNYGASVPELPEVETLRRQLRPELIGRTIVSGRAFSSAKFTQATDLVGVSITEVTRRGKYLLFELEDDRELIVHLGMTGQLRMEPSAAEPDQYERAAWLLDDDRRFVFRDVRRFGRIAVVDAGDYSSLPTLHHLGPEPFDRALTGAVLHAALRSSDRRIKTQLLSQRPIAGVGNIYADEAAWLAMVNPTWRRVTRPEAERLLDALRHVLADGIEHGGTTLRDYRTVDGGEGEHQRHLECYGRGGRPGSRCGTELVAKSIDARTTTWCPVCQRR